MDPLTFIRYGFISKSWDALRLESKHSAKSLQVVQRQSLTIDAAWHHFCVSSENSGGWEMVRISCDRRQPTVTHLVKWHFPTHIGWNIHSLYKQFAMRRSRSSRIGTFLESHLQPDPLRKLQGLLTFRKTTARPWLRRWPPKKTLSVSFPWKEIRSSKKQPQTAKSAPLGRTKSSFPFAWLYTHVGWPWWCLLASCLVMMMVTSCYPPKLDMCMTHVIFIPGIMLDTLPPYFLTRYIYMCTRVYVHAWCMDV